MSLGPPDGLHMLLVASRSALVGQPALLVLSGQTQ